MEKGKLIVIEGACDGIGKSTQYELLCNHLQKDGVKIANHHFPSYDTYQATPVMNYLNGDYGQTDELSQYFVHSLYAIDRSITWNTHLKLLYDAGATILLDRYTTSSLIYQAALIQDIEDRKQFINFVIDYEYNKLGIKEPDNVIFLHAPFDLVTKMRNARKHNEGINNDIHESNLDFMKKVYENGMFLADYLSWNKVKCNNGNQMKSIDQIHEEVYKLVR